MDLVSIKQMLIKHEGVSTKPYRDSVGKLTIGVGRNLDDEGVSKDEIDLMLTNDIFNHISDLDSHLSWWRGLDEIRQRVLLDMCFNLGIGGLLGFKKTLEFAKNGQYEQAGDEMLNSDWAVQVGDRAKELSEMMKKGE